MMIKDKNITMKYYNLTGTWKVNDPSLPTTIKLGIGETPEELSIHADPQDYDVWSILENLPSPGDDLGEFIVTSVEPLETNNALPTYPAGPEDIAKQIP